jgi:hypothetical protein
MVGESGPAYTAFLIYRDLGPRRTINAAYAHHKAQTAPRDLSAGPHKAPKAPGTWKLWARTHHWDERARAWDAHRSQIEQDARDKALAAAVETAEAEWAARRHHIRERAHGLALKLFEKAEQMLAMPIVRRKTEDNGQIVIFEPAKWSFGTVATFLEIANKTARLAANMPLEVEDEPADNVRDLLFEAPGQIAAAAPASVVPEMPVDVVQKPTITTSSSTTPGADGAPIKPAKVRPG